MQATVTVNKLLKSANVVCVGFTDAKRVSIYHKQESGSLGNNIKKEPVKHCLRHKPLQKS